MALVAKPTSLKETGLSQWTLADLACKHLAEAGVLDLGEIAQRLKLPGAVIEELLLFLRAEGRVELRSRRDHNAMLRFGLTDAGRRTALDALQKDGYVGPAPITLEMYRRLVAAQSARLTPATREKTLDIFADTVIDPELLNRLGPAVHSGRAIFIYGMSGTGKSFVSRRLHRLIGAPVLLPHAVAVGEHLVPYFDPSLHKVAGTVGDTQSGRLNEGYDARLLRCERPLVVAGGELTMDLLDLQYDRSVRSYAAPLQLKANLGLFVIDDLGRQRVDPTSLLNRWILPMEEGRDQLSLKSGHHFSVPFDLTLVFSTNLQPSDLADEAFLRRIGYKVRFEPASHDEYARIWQQACEQLEIGVEPGLLSFALEELHARYEKPLLQCFPRDLLLLAGDYASYCGDETIGRETLVWAWNNYFLENGSLQVMS
ncbi:MAG: AAA family ATPase [Sedimenticolaceae bacterium]